MDIVHCIDNSYVAQCGVTITSVCVNNAEFNLQMQQNSD